MQLSAEHTQQWAETGRLVLRAQLDAETMTLLARWAGQIERWASRPEGPGMHHFEKTPSGPRVARSEDFDPHHGGMSRFLRSGLVVDVLTQLFGEAPALFKEKINYKYPGGGGFAPHQDATAYRFVDHHISVMVPLDPSTIASGCLWFADDLVNETLPNTAGRIDPEWVDTHSWSPVEVYPGDVVFFDSYAPHRSETNIGEQRRRAMYVTYNAASRGDFRAEYYADKLEVFDADGAVGESGKARISVNDDFLGIPV